MSCAYDEICMNFVGLFNIVILFIAICALHALNLLEIILNSLRRQKNKILKLRIKAQLL